MTIKEFLRIGGRPAAAASKAVVVKMSEVEKLAAKRQVLNNVSSILNRVIDDDGSYIFKVKFSKDHVQLMSDARVNFVYEEIKKMGSRIWN